MPGELRKACIGGDLETVRKIAYATSKPAAKGIRNNWKKRANTNSSNTNNSNNELEENHGWKKRTNGGNNNNNNNSGNNHGDINDDDDDGLEEENHGWKKRANGNHPCGDNEEENNNVFSFVDEEYRNCLHLASWNGHYHLVRFLLEYTGDQLIEQVDVNKDTPLHLACRQGHTRLCNLLIECRAKVFVKNGTGESLLHAAAESGVPKIGSILIDHGIDVNSKSLTGNTPLHLASEKHKVQFIELLLEKGADMQAMNDVGGTALSIAQDNGYADLINLFESRFLEHGLENLRQAPNNARSHHNKRKFASVHHDNQTEGDLPDLNHHLNRVSKVKTKSSASKGTDDLAKEKWIDPLDALIPEESSFTSLITTTTATAPSSRSSRRKTAQHQSPQNQQDEVVHGIERMLGHSPKKKSKLRSSESNIFLEGEDLVEKEKGKKRDKSKKKATPFLEAIHEKEKGLERARVFPPVEIDKEMFQAFDWDFLLPMDDSFRMNHNDDFIDEERVREEIIDDKEELFELEERERERDVDKEKKKKGKQKIQDLEDYFEIPEFLPLTELASKSRRVFEDDLLGDEMLLFGNQQPEPLIPTKKSSSVTTISVTSNPTTRNDLFVSESSLLHQRSRTNSRPLPPPPGLFYPSPLLRQSSHINNNNSSSSLAYHDNHYLGGGIYHFQNRIRQDLEKEGLCPQDFEDESFGAFSGRIVVLSHIIT